MTRSTRHVVSLDGLRGIGALCVVCTHYGLHLFQDAPGYPGVAGALTAIDHTPLHVLFVGYPWVNMFFVLSGFALSAMVSSPASRTYLPYAINRVFRIYPAYIVVVLATFALARWLYSGPIEGLGDWFNSCWTTPPTRADAIDHAIMIGRFQTNKFVFVIWSLVHEMRISLVFPLLHAAVARLGVRGSLCAILGLVALDVAWATLADHGVLTPNTYYFTLHYAIFFWVGSVIFQGRDAIQRWWTARSAGQIAALAVIGFLLFTYGSGVDALLTPDAMRTVIAADWASAPGVVLLILFALCSAPFARLLSTPVLTFFGTISYSLYLVHGVVLLAAVHALHGVVPLGILLALCAVASVAISFASFRFLEQPFMRLGKRIART